MHLAYLVFIALKHAQPNRQNMHWEINVLRNFLWDEYRLKLLPQLIMEDFCRLKLINDFEIKILIVSKILFFGCATAHCVVRNVRFTLVCNH